MRTKVKICGITTRADAQAAIEAGCDAVGFVFYKRSPRAVGYAQAAAIIRDVPASVEKVGVFVNARERTVRRAVKACGLTMVQFHGRETPAFCSRFTGLKVIKAIRVRNAADVERARAYRTYGVLFDSFDRKAFGGTGSRFDWGLLRPADSGPAVFLAGGLTADTVSSAVRRVHPEWVDVSSGVEVSPGYKDGRKVRAFIRAAKSGA